MQTIAFAAATAASVFAGFVLILGAVQRPAVGAAAPVQAPVGQEMPMGPEMPMGQPMAGPTIPPVQGFAQGQEILFIHTEASDPAVARMLTDMMGSPVLVVPRLADAPELALARVFVFTNGVPGGGPMNFQADVFDQLPGEDGYSPLRAVHLVTWNEGWTPRILRSAEELRDAATAGEVAITRTGAVVNMPLLTWPGGQR